MRNYPTTRLSVRLGVDAIWVSPIYRSPMAHFGYDVADYCDIDPHFGTMREFDRLFQEAPPSRSKSDSRFRSQSYLRPSSLVFRKSLFAHKISKRDWYHGEMATEDAEQLDEQFRWFGLGMG